MKKLLTLCLCTMAFAAMAMPNDSIGTKIIDGKLYVMHKVMKGEGVYGISKKYGVSTSDIYNANEGSDKSINVGQILLIPRGNASSSGSSGAQSSPAGTTKTEKIYHTVGKGQTLSSIARQHNTTVSKIKELNKLKSDNIQLGQKLVVGEKTTVLTPPKPKVEAPKQTPAAAQPTQTNPAPDKNTTPQTEPVKAAEPQNNVVVNPTPVAEKPMAEAPGVVNTTYSTDDGDEISESGTAIISSEGELSQERSFILHPTAKIGTIVMITNPLNNNTVFARVVGNCKPEKGVILKMSKTVASKLGVSDNAEVKVSYAK